MKKKLKLAVIILSATLAFCFINCDPEKESGNKEEKEQEVVINFDSFSTSSIIIRNNTNKRFIAFKGIPSANTLIGGIPAYADNHGLEKKKSLFNATGDNQKRCIFYQNFHIKQIISILFV